MIELERLMTQRAQLEHILDLENSGRIVRGDRRWVPPSTLLGRIKVLTVRIKAIWARSKRRRNSASESGRSRVAKQSQLGAGRQHQKAQVRNGSTARSAAKEVFKRALAKFGKTAGGPCLACRTMRARVSGDWTQIYDESWPPTGPKENCRVVSTKPGDVVELTASVSAGPNPPGPTRMGVFLRPDVAGLGTLVLGDGETRSFTSPGGDIQICAFKALDNPYNWDSDDNGSLRVRVKRKKPNLVALEPYIHSDERWVGFGYRVENNAWNPEGRNVQVALYYAKDHRLGGGVVGAPIRAHGMALAEGSFEDWNTNAQKWRVSFDQLPAPPPEATHIAAIVDIEKTVDELREDDNWKQNDLPTIQTRLRWSVPNPKPLPISQFSSSNVNDPGRHVDRVPIGVIAEEFVWNKWVPARSHCSLRIYVTSDRTGSNSGRRGWVFPPAYGGRFGSGLINIPGDEKPHPKHPAVNGLDEKRLPKGASSKNYPYLYIKCSELDPNTATLSFIYITAATVGVDHFRVELWDDIQNVLLVPPIEMEVPAYANYKLEWVSPPPSVVASTILEKAGFALDEQPKRVVVPALMRLKPTLNGKPLNKDYEIHLKVKPGALGMKGWVFPASYKKLLKANKLGFNPDKKRGYPGIREPVAESLIGVPEDQYKEHVLQLDDKHRAPFYYLAPCRGGKDFIRAHLKRKGGKRVLATLRHVVELARCGVSGLYLSGGGNSSQSYILPGAAKPPKPFAPANASDHFCFAPGPQLDSAGKPDPSKVDVVQISYEIYNSHEERLLAELRLFAGVGSKPVWVRDLTALEKKPGFHKTLLFGNRPGWDGKINPHKDFPDEFITAEHSPYRLELALSFISHTCDSEIAWSHFKVEVADVTLELGPKEVLPKDQPASGGITPGSHRALYDSLGGVLPAPGHEQQVKLLGNLFKTAISEMSDNSAFDHHKAQWADGPLIPVIAHLRLKSSNNIPVDAPLGLGNLRCLWDWEDVPEDTQLLSGSPKTFVELALNYDKATTKPKGDNCHTSRGGKRTANGGTDPVFPPQVGYDAKDALDDGLFPFKVEAASTRKWAALSLPWRKGALGGRTGVLFQPSRMAGDAYTVTCYVASEKTTSGNIVLDVEGDLSGQPVPRASTGTFVIWRKHVINRYIKKKLFAMDIPIADVQAYYHRAFVDLAVGYTAVETMSATDYKNAVAGAVSTMTALSQLAIDPSVDQHATGDCCVNFRNHADFLAQVQGAMGWTTSSLTQWLQGAGVTFATRDGYWTNCNQMARIVLAGISNAFLPVTAVSGISLAQFIGLHNIDGDDPEAFLGGDLLGIAPSVPGSTTRERAAFVECATPDLLNSEHTTLQEVTAHEIGHHLFLPHAPFPQANPPGGSRPEMHDKDDDQCTMGYNSPAEHFCGFCLVRLRGWDKTPLDKDGSRNSRP
jgi:hypothetical protein